jgi:hypothetical protein
MLECNNHAAFVLSMFANCAKYSLFFPVVHNVVECGTEGTSFRAKLASNSGCQTLASILGISHPVERIFCDLLNAVRFLECVAKGCPKDHWHHHYHNPSCESGIVGFWLFFSNQSFRD